MKLPIILSPYGFCLILVASLFVSCNNETGEAKTGMETDSLSEEQKHLSENALKSLIIADGLEVTAVANEPMLQNPTNIDVDERGYRELCEACSLAVLLFCLWQLK